MVNARTKEIFRGGAKFRVKVLPDGEMRIAVRVDRVGAAALRRAFGELLKDLSSADERDLARLSEEMR